MNDHEDRFIVRQVQLKRLDTEVPLETVAGKLGRQPEEIASVLKDFERALNRFSQYVGADTTLLLEAPSVSLNKVRVALRKLNRTAQESRDLNNSEQDTVRALILQHLNTQSVSERSAGNTNSIRERVDCFWEILTLVDFTDSELRYPDQIIRPHRGRIPEVAYTELAKELIETWRRHDVAATRSVNGYGVIALTDRLLKCFNLTVKLYDKYDKDGEICSNHTPTSRKILRYKLAHATLVEDLSGYLVTAAREASRVRRAQWNARGRES